jgi:hypothetical protein
MNDGRLVLTSVAFSLYQLIPTLRYCAETMKSFEKHQLINRLPFNALQHLTRENFKTLTAAITQT